MRSSSWAHPSQPGDALLCLLLYNFCAFALQMPVGLLADRLDKTTPSPPWAAAPAPRPS